jgi:KEOPS complex subunit Cgi121
MRLVEGRATVDDLDAFLADLDGVADGFGCTVQAFDARYVVSRDHLARALELTDRAFERGENVARDRGVEVLLYAAGRRQIDDALAMGVSEGELPVVVLVADATGGAAPDDAGTSDGPGGPDEPDEPDEAAGAESAATAAVGDRLTPAGTLGRVDPDRVREFFDVTDRELAATDGSLEDAVLERVALLDVRK